MSAAALPQYKCRKTVQALKLRSVEPGTEPTLIPGGSWVLTPEEPDHAALEVSHDWVLKNKPQAGGYFVLYEDGYTSYSPAAAFESGYTRISDSFQDRVIAEKQALDVKIKALWLFINGPAFRGLSQDDRLILNDQFNVMCQYSRVLHRRIARFVPPVLAIVPTHPIDASKLLRSAGTGVKP